MSRLVTGVSVAPGVGVDGIGSRDGAVVGVSLGVGDGVADGVEGTVGDGAEADRAELGVGVGVGVGVEAAVGLPPLQAAIRRMMATVPTAPTMDRPRVSGAMNGSSSFIPYIPPVVCQRNAPLRRCSD